MSEKPLKAYHVGEGSEGEHVIVFATSGAAGRRKGGNELSLEFEEVEFCNAGKKVFVKHGPFFQAQGGLTQDWGKGWTRIKATSIKHARQIGEEVLP